MHTHRGSQPDRPLHARGPHRAHALALAVILGGAAALMLYLHGASWWYAPLAVPGIVLAHVAILGGLFFTARRVTPGRFASARAARGQEDAEHSRRAESKTLHNPRQFELLTRLCTFGQEGKLRQWTLDIADLQPGNVVLDVGCGTGALLLAAAQRIGPVAALYGIDAAPEMVSHARRKAEAHQVQLEVVEGSADRLPYPPASFDAVFCTLTLHHLPASMRDAAIREMRRVLRPGGRVVIVDWQRPKSLVKAIFSPMFLVYLLHKPRSGASPFDTLDIEPLMKEISFDEIARSSFGAGGVGAVISRLRAGTRATDQAEQQGRSRVDSDA